MSMNRKIAFTTAFLLAVFTTVSLSAKTNDDDYEAQNAATNWYADRSEGIILRFEGLRHDAGELAQKFTVIPREGTGAVKYALVVSTWDERKMVMFTPNGNDVSGKVVDKSVFTETVYWNGIHHLLQYCSHKSDITLSKRPLPVREVDQASNYFLVVVDESDKVSDISRYNQMMFKPHVNEVRFVRQDKKILKGENGDTILDERAYQFKLKNPAVRAKMFRGYKDEEMAPWIVTNDFFTDHSVLQFTRWKDGEAKTKASPDVCRIISAYYGGRKIKDTQWVASVAEAERSFYAVQFENQGGDALAALVCLAEGDVVSAWEFHGDMVPREYKDGESIWFVDDEGDFMEHVPELQCIVATNSGLELYVRVFGGESVQYYVLREVGHVWMLLQVDYYIWAWG